LSEILSSSKKSLPPTGLALSFTLLVRGPYSSYCKYFKHKIYTKKMITVWTRLTVFQIRFTASGSPVDFILPNFSLFVPFNRVNLWYFSIFFCFYFSDSYSMFKKPCMASFESLQGSYWSLFNKRFTVTVGCTWCFPLSRPNGVMQRLKTNHAWQFKHVVWVRKIKTKKYCKISEIYPVKRDKKRKL